MRKVYPKVGLGTLCGLFGYSRQAYYKRQGQEEKERMQAAVIVDEVHRIREKIPRIGGRKLFFMLQHSLLAHDIAIGRDRFFNILRANDLLIKRRRKRPLTTMSKHYLKKYPNLIEGFEPDAPNLVWVSDITYVKVAGKWHYVIFITDAYSHQVVGWRLGAHATAAFCIKALEQALEQWSDRTKRLIHHSDRGVQYCSYAYTDKLKDNKILISMTQNGDPRENPVAERVNGIFKGDFLMDQSFDCFQQALSQIRQMVYHYNHTRPHASCDFLTPIQAHSGKGPLKKRWKRITKVVKELGIQI